MSGIDRDGDLGDGRPGPPRRKTYGRRRGRSLKSSGKSLLDRVLPGVEIALPRTGTALAPSRLFAHEPRILCLEIGFGAGEHVAWQASRHPGWGFLAAEVFLDGMVGLLRRIERDRLDNIRIHHGDARDLLDALPPASLARVFILFPDPWPKRRHHKRRLLQVAFLDSLAVAMEDAGELRLATDDIAYLRWMLQCLTCHRAFEWLARRPRDWRVRPPDWPATRYETKALEAGRRPSFLRFQRKPRRPTSPGIPAGPGTEEKPLAEKDA